MKKRTHQAEVPAVADRPAHDAAEDVSAAFVGWQDAVADQKRHGPAVVGDHLHRHVGLRRFTEPPPGKRLGLLHDRHDEIGIVVGGGILQNGDDPFEAHAGIDARLGQRRHVAGLVAVELHEHQVPDLKKAVALASQPAVRAAAEGGAPVDMDFGARTAGAGIAHRPEIVFFTEPDDPLFRHTDGRLPEVERLVVVKIDRHPELFRRQSAAVGQKVPCKFDGFFLEVVPEGKISQHLEKGVVPGGIADIFQIVVLSAGPDAFLGGGRPDIAPLLLA